MFIPCLRWKTSLSQFDRFTKSLYACLQLKHRNIPSCQRNSYALRSLHNILFTYFNCIYSLNRECVSYHKPGQTGKVIQPSYNRTQKPFQSWSTNITSDSRMILWTQDTRKWFSPGQTCLTTDYRGRGLFKWGVSQFSFLYNIQLCD